MTYEEFLKASNDLKAFFKEQKKLDAALNVISPSGTSVVEFGNEFVDSYIDVVEVALGDESNSFSWFVFTNDFGAKKLQVRVDGVTYRIKNEKDFFDICITL